ncbi:Protein CROWDED NUCLEI 4 [Glycine soja]|uniref:Protein CROWDED NUCLEI 4 n=4 Tax=Glycine subgen. Soja TaxID=1462606 RepID=A0A0R0HM25_SOYBN|nr:Protein CROWDED NUCLEI 4 [Glycine soja]
MATPITPDSATLASRDPWKRLKQPAFDDNSIQRKDKIYDQLHHMGCLIFERKLLAFKYEQVKASIDSSEFMHKHDSAMNLSALIEARKREESLKMAIGINEACIASLEKALHEMRTECAETKVSAESKVSEAHQLIDEAQKKSTEAEAKLRAAESFQAEACGYYSVADRKLRDVEAREDELRRQIKSFKSDRSQELDSLQKELEDTKTNTNKEHGALCDEKTNLKLMEATLTIREEALSKRESELNKKEQELLDLQVKLASRESDETQKVKAVQEAELGARKTNFEAELQIQLKLVENEIEMKRWAWELKEVDLTQREEKLQEREHELEILSRTLGEKEKDLVDMSSALKEKDQSLRASEKELELNKVLLQKDKEEINKTKLDVQMSLVSLENNLRQFDNAKERHEALKSETNDLSVLEVKLKEEIDVVRSQKLEIVAEADKLEAEKAKFEAQWELLDEKKEELRKEAEYIAEEKKAVSAFIKKERDKLRQEKENMRDQYKRDLESLTCEREEFMNKMAHEHDDWFGKMQQERANFLRDVEMQNRNMNILIDKRREEIESYLKEREKSFEEEKNNQLEYINALKEKVAKEYKQVSFEMRRLEVERPEISSDCEQRNKIEIHAQTEELKKVKDLKIVSDDIALTELLNSDMESNQQKISMKKKLNQRTLKHDDHLNSPQKIDANKISNGFDSSFVQNSSVVLPSSPVRFSWIKRCTKLVFRRSPEKSLVHDDDKGCG